MKKIQREDIYIIRRHSNLSDKGIDKALKENEYPNKAAWHSFLRLLFLILGFGFSISGVLFFFAYNWADLHKFVKIGILEALIVGAIISVLLLKVSSLVRNIIFTISAMLVGVLFAVFGQIYQTGADAYDLFLAWTILISLWVFVSNFAPLWLFYLLLWNTTIILYTQQVGHDWSEVLILSFLVLLNTIVLIPAFYLSRNRDNKNIPNWFLYVVALTVVTYATIGIIIGIFDETQDAFPIFILVVVLLYALGIWHGVREKSGFYLSLIPFSSIVIISALLIKMADGESMLLLVSFWIITSVTIVIKALIHLQKKWINEK